MKHTTVHAPRFFKTRKELPKGTIVIDAFLGSMKELFFVEHPNIAKTDPQAKTSLQTFLAHTRVESVFVYYPWHKTAVRIPDEKTYFRLRTARNRELISEDEQRMYRDAVVGIAGLSVGSRAVASLVATGGPKQIKIADPDIVEVTNLNRMRATLLDVGENKADVAARVAWELDPFAHIETWGKGLDEKGLDRFINNEPALTVFIDEMDDIAIKFATRFECRAAGVPVVMATDNGDSVIVDVERFDLEPTRPIFHGRVRVPRAKLGSMTREQFVALSTTIIDPFYFTPRQQQTILAIGKRVSGVAQLGTAATIAGAAVSYIVRRIVTGEAMPSGRYVLSSEASFIPGYDTPRAKKKREVDTKTFLQTLAKAKKQKKGDA